MTSTIQVMLIPVPVISNAQNEDDSLCLQLQNNLQKLLSVQVASLQISISCNILPELHPLFYCNDGCFGSIKKIYTNKYSKLGRFFCFVSSFFEKLNCLFSFAFALLFLVKSLLRYLKECNKNFFFNSFLLNKFGLRIHTLEEIYRSHLNTMKTLTDSEVMTDH